MADDDDVTLEALERRYERERRARLEAEAIAEQGLRDLYTANRSLDERIRTRTRELEAATARAEAANAAKSEFLAHIGHELRTPINGIAGMLELLDRVITEPDARAWLSSARVSTARLERLFDRILWFIELEAADLSARVKSTSVEAVVDEAAERWRQPCARGGQLLSVDIATPLDTAVPATEELGRAIDELLDNAVRHASPGALRLGARLDTDVVRFSVDDSGPGIASTPVTEPPVLLDPGEPAATRRTAGAGIGLALVRRIAGALGGESGIEPNATGGSSAWIAVPVSA